MRDALYEAMLADDIIREPKPRAPAAILPLAESNWGEGEEAAIRRVMASGRYTMGPEVKKFERQFARHVGRRFAVMVNSGSSANLLMVAALHYTKWLPRNSTVVVPAVSWSTTYAPLIQYGMRLRVVDVDDSLNIDPAQIRDGDLLFAVNLLGNPCDFDRFPKQMPLIVDNCESQGCYYHGREGGSYGMMASYSFFFSHHLQTMEGGMIGTDDEELYQMLLMLRAHGWERDLPGYQPGFEASYRFHVPGYSVRPTEIQGAIGQEQLTKEAEMRYWRRINGKTYQRLFRGQVREVGNSSWFAFAFLTPNREKVLKSVSAETRPIVAGNIMRHPMMRYAEVESGPLPMAERIHAEGFYIGNHPRDLTAELETIHGQIGSLL